MEQGPRRFTTQHVGNVLRGYSEGLLDRATIEETLGIGRTRLFGLLKLYRPPFLIPIPSISTQDVLCLKETQVVNPYQYLTFYQQEIPLEHIPSGEKIDLRLAPNLSRESVEIRVWWRETMIQSMIFSFGDFPRVRL
jgi:hypothetical protein